MTRRTPARDFAGFPVGTIEFLRELRANNTREWFEEHRPEYQRHYVDSAKEFVVAAGARLRELAPGIVAEPRVLGSIFRVNRDTRFSKDKRPYKDYLDFWFWEGERKRAVSGFFVRVSLDVIGIGVGCHAFDAEHLEVYRRAVASPDHGAELIRIAGQLDRDGYEIGGAHYARIPRGYDPHLPAARFLRHKGLFVHHDEMPTLATEGHLMDVCVLHWDALVPLHRWLVSAVQ